MDLDEYNCDVSIFGAIVSFHQNHTSDSLSVTTEL